MLEFLRRHELAVFLHLVVVISFVFTFGVANGVIPMSLFSYGRFLLLGIAVFVIVFTFRGIEGVLYVVRPMLVWKRPIGWYAFALLLCPLFALVFLAGYGIVTGRGLGLIELNLNVATRFDVLIRLAFGSLVGELVWISYCLRKMAGRSTPYIAGLVIGFYWALWWYPAVLTQIGVLPGLNIGSLLIAQTAVALTCSFLYARTESGFLVFIMQVIFQITLLVLPVAPTTGGPTTFLLFSIAYFLFATALFLVYGPKPLFASPGRAAAAARAETI
ncbi:hypothetical protein HKCCE2091_10420 [Rhodobacterales bacterium HKCCE2091]|nr:hypothetical protein [Rhodobacterales bacterium HKCCE2091]